MIMKIVKCSICSLQFTTVKSLKSHYMKKHWKKHIVTQIIKNEMLRVNFKSSKNKPKSRRDVREMETKPQQDFIYENLHIKYNGNTISIENESVQDKLVELRFSNNCELKVQNAEGALLSAPALSTSTTKPKKRLKKIQRVQIGITKISSPINNHSTQSLNYGNGEFYECHCMNEPPVGPPQPPPASSDTESVGSESTIIKCECDNNGRQCAKVVNSLKDDNRNHNNQVVCKLCNKIFDWISYKEHFEQHVIRIYVCHNCGNEFVSKHKLTQHLNYHQEQQTLNDVLDMQQSYCHYANYANQTNVENIEHYLRHPYDQSYFRGYVLKVPCGICRLEVPSHEYENHLKSAHCFHP